MAPFGAIQKFRGDFLGHNLNFKLNIFELMVKRKKKNLGLFNGSYYTINYITRTKKFTSQTINYSLNKVLNIQQDCHSLSQIKYPE